MKLLKVKEKFRSFKLCRSHFQNSEHFQKLFSLNYVSIRFFWGNHFDISILWFSFLRSKTWTVYDIIAKRRHFWKMWMGCHSWDIAGMMSLTQNQFYRKLLVNTNQHAQFGVPVIFSLEVSWWAHFCPLSSKMRWLNVPCKTELNHNKVAKQQYT